MMGTNYYALADATCDNPDHNEKLHIGKSSGGWKFGFHGIPDHEPPLTSWSAWKIYLADHTIVDEYGSSISLSEFIRVVDQRWTPAGSAGPRCRVSSRDSSPLFSGERRDYHDPEGYDFYNGEFS